MNIFNIISLLCNLVMLGCVIYLRNELDVAKLKHNIVNNHCRIERESRHNWVEQTRNVSTERDAYKDKAEALEAEITELKLERYKHISSYYQRNGGVEDE